jgi:hypothetical protein
MSGNLVCGRHHVGEAHSHVATAAPGQTARETHSTSAGHAEQLNLTEYGLWIVTRQLDELEALYPKRRAPLGIRRLGQGETVIYLPDRAP